MNKYLLIGFCLVAGLAKSQTADQKWNIGLHGGANQYAGEWGNDFYHFDQPFYGHVGLSISRYLTRHFDASLFVTAGEMGHFEQGMPMGARNKFLTDLKTANLVLRYHVLGSAAMISPYLFAGGGVLMQRSLDNDVALGGQYDWAQPAAGVGVNYRLTPVMSLQFQETYMYTSADGMDLMTGGRNDSYLFHTLGITFNFGGKGKSANGGVGDKINQCTDVSKRKRH